MVKTAIPPGLEAGFAQPVMTTLIQPSEDKLEGGREPQATAVQQSHEKTPHQAEGVHRSRPQDS